MAKVCKKSTTALASFYLNSISAGNFGGIPCKHERIVNKVLDNVFGFPCLWIAKKPSNNRYCLYCFSFRFFRKLYRKYLSFCAGKSPDEKQI